MFWNRKKKDRKPKEGEVLSVVTNIFDEEELYENCTVQILRNSVTGEMSIGWWPNSNPPVAMGGDEDDGE